MRDDSTGLTGRSSDPQFGPPDGQQCGNVYVCDAGDRQGKGGAVYRIDRQRRVSVLLDAKNLRSKHSPSGLVMDGASHLILLDAGSGELHRIQLADSSTGGGFPGS